jgi:hypothetical protein
MYCQENSTMLAVALFFLGLASCIVAASVCLSIGRLMHVNNSITKGDTEPAWDKEKAWDEMKAAFFVWYVRYMNRESENRQKVLSWARTFLLCAGLCLIGVCVQVEMDEAASIPNIAAHIKQLRKPHAAATVAQPAQTMQQPATQPTEPAGPRE